MGLITLIALSAKNAILIVEFAVLKNKEGLSFAEAALEAGKSRLRANFDDIVNIYSGRCPFAYSYRSGEQ